MRQFPSTAELPLGDSFTKDNPENLPDFLANNQIEVFEAHDFLSIKPPTALIGPQIYEVKNQEKKIFIGTLFNPGQVPDITTLGAAIAQVGEAALLREIPSYTPNTRSSKTPMVTKISDLQILKDIKTPNQAKFWVVCEVDEDKNVSTSQVKGQIYYQDENNRPHKIGAAQLQMQRLRYQSLLKVRARKNSFEEAIAPQDIPKTKSEDFCIPGYGEDLSLEIHQHEDGLQSIAQTKIRPGLSTGHFLDHEIIPIHITAIPGFFMILKHFKQKYKSDIVDIAGFSGLEVFNALGPNDHLQYEVRQIGNTEYELNVFAQESSEKPFFHAAKFAKITVKPAQRQNQTWRDPATAAAFNHQSAIPEYQEHLDDFEVLIKAALDNLSKTENLRICDLGTGVKANILRLISQQITPQQRLNTHVTLQDVDFLITKAAAKALVEDFPEHRGRVKQIVSSPGEIIPPSLAPQDLITANFVLNYGQTELEMKKLADSLNPKGEAILGFVSEHPKYYQLMNKIGERVRDSQDWAEYDQIQIMKLVGSLMDKLNMLGIQDQCQFFSPEVVLEWCEKMGLELLNLQTETFYGLGFIIRVKKL